MENLKKVINNRSKLKNEFLDIVDDFKKANDQLEKTLKKLKVKETELKNKIKSKLVNLTVELQDLNKKKAEVVQPLMKEIKVVKSRMTSLTKKERDKLVDIHEEMRNVKDDISNNEAVMDLFNP